MLYKKVEKDVGNPFGIEKIEKSNPLADGPCLICLAAQPAIRYNVGIMRVGMDFARIRTSRDNGSKVLVGDSDITFCTYDRENGDRIEDFFQDFILPIIESVKDKTELLKSFRNLNFLGYCNAATEINELFQLTENALNEKGYSPKDIEEIMKNITCMSIGTSQRIDSLVTSFIVMDVNDLEGVNSEEELLEFREVVDKSSMMDKVSLIHNGNQNALVLDGDGNHTAEYLLLKGDVMRATLPIIVTQILENARTNSKTQEYIPLDLEKMINDVQTTIKDITNGKENSKSILEGIDRAVYKELPRASYIVLELTSILDLVSKRINKVHVSDNSKICESYAGDFNGFLEKLKGHITPEQYEYIVNGKPNNSVTGYEYDKYVKMALDQTYGKSSFYQTSINGENVQKEYETVAGYSMVTQPAEVVKILDKIKAIIKEKISQIDTYNQNYSEHLAQLDNAEEILGRIMQVVPQQICIDSLVEQKPNIVKQYSRLPGVNKENER